MTSSSGSMYFKESISTPMSSLHRVQFGRLIVTLSIKAPGSPHAASSPPFGAQ